MVRSAPNRILLRKTTQISLEYECRNVEENLNLYSEINIIGESIRYKIVILYSFSVSWSIVFCVSGISQHLLKECAEASVVFFEKILLGQ